MENELAKLQRQNAEMGYLINRIDEQYQVIADELKYLESLIRNTKEVQCS